MAVSLEQIAYFSITYEQLILEFENRARVLLPEVTPVTEDPIFRSLQIFANVIEILGLRLNLQAREAILSTSSIFSNMVAHAESLDYRVQGAIGDKVLLTFSLDDVATSDYTIPQFTEVSNQDGSIVYQTLEATTIAANQLATQVTAQQQQNISNIIGTTDGQQNQTITVVLNEDGQSIADNSILLTISTDTYTPVETFFFSLNTDNHFIQRINENGLTEVLLADGINGKLPANGLTINATYKKTQGLNGRVQSGDITSVVTTLPPPPDSRILSVTNAEQSDAGQDIQTVSDLQRILPRLRFTNNRAVTEQDFIDVTESLTTVEKAGVNVTGNNTDIEIYIVPAGGGLATQILLDEVKAYIDARKVIGYNTSIFSAGIIQIIIEANVTVNSAFAQTTVVNTLTSALVSITDTAKTDEVNRIGGTIGTDDITDTAKDVGGVDRFLITVLNLRPYARPLTGKILDWDVEMLPDSNTLQELRIVFDTPNTYEVRGNNVVLGTGSVGVATNIQNKVQFVINQNYVTNDAWSFYIYPYLGNTIGVYQLNEPSRFLINEDDITLTVSGGIT